VTDASLAVGGRADGAAPAAVGNAKTKFSWAWLGLVPFLAFLGLFLIVPAISVMSKSLYDADGNFGFDSLRKAFSGENLKAFSFSVRLSAVSAAVGVVLGGLLAYAASSVRRPKWLRSLVTSFSGVAANLGGVPLAFAFLALIGRQGIATKILSAFGLDLYGGDFAIDDIWGFTTVYAYFQIPLMVLITLPAIDGLKSSWRESAANLGGTSFTYWTRVGLPVLAPSLLGGFFLLFANAFSAYATAAALTNKSLIVPLRIGFYLRGDFGGEEQLGYSLATWMVIVMAVCVSVYWLLRKRAERWTM
jgi:putative spermidine/putrescine transport system permease protein